jgi:hypothetical protein
MYLFGAFAYSEKHQAHIFWFIVDLCVNPLKLI